jgi:hypothetical protein
MVGWYNLPDGNIQWDNGRVRVELGFGCPLTSTRRGEPSPFFPAHPSRRVPSMKIAYVAAAVALLGLASPALADVQDFTIHNNTGHPIYHVYVSEADNDKWENDVLGEAVLEDGDEHAINFTGYGADVCKFDIRVDFENDAQRVASDIDLCAMTDIKVTYDGEKVSFTKE